MIDIFRMLKLCKTSLILSSLDLLYPAAANYAISVVEGHRLARSDRRLLAIKADDNFRIAPLNRRYQRSLRLVLIPDLGEKR